MNRTIRERYGIDQDGKSLLHVKVGRIGGRVKCRKGFGVNHDSAVRAGRIGGTISRRTKKV